MGKNDTDWEDIKKGLTIIGTAILFGFAFGYVIGVLAATI